MHAVTVLVFAGVSAVAAASVQPPPANDNCSAPIVLAATGVYPFDTTMASTTSGIGLGFCPTRGTDIWYAWTAPQTGIASFFTCNQSTFDTNIAVFNNGPCPVGGPVTCDDDACGNLESLVSWFAQSGVTYYLQLGSSGGGPGGTGSFTLDFQLPPANDDCGAAIDLVSGTGASYDNTLGSTGIQGQSNPGCTPVTKDLWYQWTATQNGSATLDTCGQTGDDTALAVYVGTGCPAATAIACDDDSCGSQSTVTWSITAGTVYTLQIGGSTFGNGGAGSFSIVEAGSGFTGTVYCPGDGSQTACPCGNSSAVGADEGCASSLTNGGALRGSGSASIANDTFVLTATGVPNGPGLYFQGTARAAAGAGIAFGDGLLCVSGSITRLGVVFASGNSSTFPSGVLPPASVAGSAAAGNTLDYQLWYRDATIGFCTSAVFNLTNAVELVWAP